MPRKALVASTLVTEDIPLTARWDEAVFELLRTGADHDLLALLREHNADTLRPLTDRKVAHGVTAIYAAVRENSLECVDELLDLDADIRYTHAASEYDEQLWQRLDNATERPPAVNGSLAADGQLGASQLRAKLGGRKLTELQTVALHYRSESLASRALRRSHENSKDRARRGLAPLHLACLLDQFEVLRELIKHLETLGREAAIAELNMPTEEKERTPALFCAKTGSHRCLQLLLESGFPIEVDWPNNRGDSPIHVASDEGKHQCLSLLINAGARIDAR